MHFVIFMAVLGALAGLGLKQIWYPILAILVPANILLYTLGVSLAGSTDKGLVIIAAVVMTLIIGACHYMFLRTSRKLAPKRAIDARHKSHAQHIGHSVRRDSDEYLRWHRATANEWWRQYPDAQGKMDEPLEADPFTVEAVEVRRLGTSSAINGLDLRRPVV